MADHNLRHSEIITHLLRLLTSSTHDVDVKEDIFKRTIYRPRLVVIALIFSELRRGQFRPPPPPSKKTFALKITQFNQLQLTKTYGVFAHHKSSGYEAFRPFIGL